MLKDKILKLTNVFKTKLAEKDEKIAQLEAEVKASKSTKTVMFEFPEEVSVKNFPEQKEFPKDIKINNLEDIKFPEFKDSVKVTNLKDINIEFPKSFEVSNLKEVDPDYKPTWIDGMVEGFFVILSGLLNKVTSKTFEVKTSEESRLKPQMVMFINPKTGRPESVQAHFHGGGGMGGPNAVWLRNTAGDKINPATNEKLDEVVNALENISINAESVNLNTDELEASVKDALDDYKISDVDDSGTTKYYGFLKKDGGYYILREDTVAKTFRYFKGDSGYETPTTGAWATRASKSYGYFHNIF